MDGKLKYLIAAVAFVVFTGVGHLYAQSTMDLRINEILVYNDSNYVDDFGRHTPWIEVFNSAYNKVNMGGCYLTDDLLNPTKYLIGRDPVTVIPTRGYLVFRADNNPLKGTLHLNFNLNPGKTIALFDINGKTLIDKVTIPENVVHDVSYGRLQDGASAWENLDKTTPGSNNNTQPGISSGEEFKKSDPSGTGMIAIAMGVVFFALAALYLLFRLTARLLKMDIKKQLLARSATRAKAGVSATSGEDHKGLEITGEINAAIAMTLYLYTSELHDAENTVLTINKVSRTYSPWSSKIYGLNRLPN